MQSTEKCVARDATPALDVLRVSQVDARRLDDELLEILHEQMSRCVDAFRACASASGRASAETSVMPSRASSERTRLALDAAVFAWTTARNAPTPGQELMNLRFRNERKYLRDDAVRRSAKTGVEGEGLSIAQRAVYGLVKCVGAYAWSAWTRRMVSERFDEARDDGEEAWKARFWRWSRFVEDAHAMMSFVNFCVFLRNGRYPTLVERLLGARLVYGQPTMARVVDFEYLNQQLAWRELSELVLFTLPYVYNTRVRSLVGSIGARRDAFMADTQQGRRVRVSVQAHRCVACGCAEPVHPFVAEPCGHPYCYYCLRARLQERPTDCACVKCSKPVARMRRVEL